MKLNAEIDSFNRILPLYNSDYDALKKAPKNTEVEIDIKQKRNPGFHRKGMALLNLAFANQDKFEAFNHFRYWITMKAGFVDIVKTPDGVMYLPQSISFSSMDNIKFQEWYNAMINQVIILLGTDEKKIEKELAGFM